MNKLYVTAVALAGFWFGLSGASSAAENSIKQIQTRRDGDQVLVKVQMSTPLKTLPGNWSVIDPPRVVIDFPDTDNQSGQSTQQVAAGDLKSLNVVQTEKLTRLVLNLYRPTKFSTEMVGDVLFVKLQSQSAQAGQEPAPSVYQPMAPTSLAAGAAQPVPAADTAAIRDIVVRRGEEGQGIITVDLTDGTVPIDIHRTGTGITVDLRDVELPERLRNRRDVNDFATPVTTMTSRAMGNLTRLEIAARGRWFHQAQVANNQLIIEVRPIPTDDANKLVQTGQQGQKVSINFFSADATMVLRTLADISGKNVMVDPSLNGRTVTVSLDNIPYDQALEIIMAQVNAGMRVRNDIVLFGDRGVLQKRDQDIAEELTRASDIAPLVAETFKLNYVKTADILALVNSNLAAAPPAGGLSGLTIPTAGTLGAIAPPPATPSVGTPTAPGSSGKGMLSARGVISAHDSTNQIFVRDTAAVIESIREVIRSVDVPSKQVMIEARIVEASTGFLQSLGVRMRWAASDTLAQGGYSIGPNGLRGALGTSTSFGSGNTDIFGAGGPPVPTLTRAPTIFQPSYSLASAANFGLMLFNSAGSKLLALELQASESDLKNKTVSSPRIVTMNRKAATINNTQQVTILTGVNATTGLPIYQTFSAPLTLAVTPSVNPDNRISLELNIAKSTITNATTGSLDTNTVTTSVIVENGGTVVIGGFARESENQVQDRVPFLGDLPYVGFLFKTTTKNQQRSELLVFITPRIISDALTQR